MKKSELVGAQYALKNLTQMHDNNLDKLMDIISAAFSALATAEPSYALETIKQLNAQKKQIEALEKERAEQESEYIKEAVKYLADSIEFDEED